MNQDNNNIDTQTLIGMFALTAVVGILSFLFILEESLEKESRPVHKVQNIPTDFSNIKSYNYQEDKWETYKKNPTISRNLSDEEIRILREKQSFDTSGSYIHTPSRKVPTYKEQNDEAIEAYIEEHGQEIYEQLEDKYGN